MTKYNCRPIFECFLSAFFVLAALAALPRAACGQPVDEVSYIFVLAFPDTQDVQAWRKVMTAYSSAKTHVSFRIQIAPSGGQEALTAVIAKLRANGASYFLTAGSSDWGTSQLFWEPSILCARLSSAPDAKGLYLHEIMSARASAKQSFDDSDLQRVLSLVECAHKAGKKVIWSEWAGSTWGWQTLLDRASHGGLAMRILRDYSDTLVLSWGDNRDSRRVDQLSDMQLAMREVSSTARQYSLQHGASLQDWAWTESGGGTKPMPAEVISRPGIEAFNAGARYFEFETYWGASPNFLSGVSDLDHYIRGALIKR